MDLEQTKCFLEVAKEKSISKASYNLHITQPALSKKIKALEDYLGTNLFFRNSTGVTLTKEGVFFLENIENVVEQFEAIKSGIKNVSNVNYISIGALASIATYILPNILNSHPSDMTIDLKVSNVTRDLINDYKENKLNALIVESIYGELLEQSYEDVLFYETFYMITPINHKLKEQSKISLSDIGNEPIILYPKECPVHQVIKKHFENYNISPLIINEISFSDSILSLVSAGQGITFLPEIIVKNNKNFEVKALKLVEPITRTISVFAKEPSIKQYISDEIKKELGKCKMYI